MLKQQIVINKGIVRKIPEFLAVAILDPPVPIVGLLDYRILYTDNSPGNKEDDLHEMYIWKINISYLNKFVNHGNRIIFSMNLSKIRGE